MNNENYKIKRVHRDPTADEAVGNVYRSHTYAEKDAEKRFAKTLRLIFATCELGGFTLENRIILRDNKTGRVFE